MRDHHTGYDQYWDRRVTQITALLALLCSGTVACSERAMARGSAPVSVKSNASSDEAPQVLNAELPFRYPARQYAMRVEGNVTLYLHITATGQVLPESTRVAESSGQPALDSAALAGTVALEFRPARKRNGAAVGMSILFPVYFRHPNGPASP